MQKTNATVAHATGSAHAAVKGGGGGGDKGGGGGGSGLRKEAQGAGFAGEAAYSASGNDDAVNEYLSSIRQVCAEILVHKGNYYFHRKLFICLSTIRQVYTYAAYCGPYVCIYCVC